MKSKTVSVRWFVELIVIVAVVGGFFYGVLQPFVVKPFRIPTASMWPTLKVGDRVVTNRLAIRTGNPGIGDVVVFRPSVGCGSAPSPGKACDQPSAEKNTQEHYIKRVVGLPGDRVRVVSGKVIRNGKSAAEPFAQPCRGNTEEERSRKCDFPREITVPPGHFFMMGDNRGDSLDSRFLGPVPKKWLVGVAFAKYWPLGDLGGV